MVRLGVAALAASLVSCHATGSDGQAQGDIYASDDSLPLKRFQVLNCFAPRAFEYASNVSRSY